MSRVNNIHSLSQCLVYPFLVRIFSQTGKWLLFGSTYIHMYYCSVLIPDSSDDDDITPDRIAAVCGVHSIVRYLETKPLCWDPKENKKINATVVQSDQRLEGTGNGIGLYAPAVTTVERNQTFNWSLIYSTFHVTSIYSFSTILQCETMILLAKHSSHVCSVP